MANQSQLPLAAVFFARDFLADEFAKLGAQWGSVARIYIVANEAERAKIAEKDDKAIIFTLFGQEIHPDTQIPPLETAFNNERHLRFMNDAQIRQIAASVRQLCDAISAQYRVAYYLDEPVSGYPNWEFNRHFRAAGALCLQFQASWVPGLLFFTSDPAQDDPVPLGLISDGQSRVAAHVAARKAGAGRPNYVIGYHKLHKRLADIATTYAKAAYRLFFRRSAPYIDRDPSAHFLHAKALLKSLTGRYHWKIDPQDRLLIFPLHYEPEAVLDYFCAFRRQHEIAEQLLDSLPLGWKLVLKEHPSQPGALHLSKWHSLRQSKRVLFLRGDFPGASLLKPSSIVLTIGSTFGLESALAGCPTGILGGVHFADAPGLTRLNKPADWHNLHSSPHEHGNELLKWYGDFLDRYCFAGNIMRGKTDLGDKAALIAAFERQYHAMAMESAESSMA